MAREMMRRDPARFDLFEDFRSMRRLMDRFMGGGMPMAYSGDDLGGLEEPLPVDVFEKGDEVIVKAALPGVNPDDVDIRVADGILHIRAESRDEQDVDEGDFHRREYRYGRFSRSFRLPPNLDTTKAEAQYDNGMLRLRFPKTEAAGERSIKIEVSGSQPRLQDQQPRQQQQTQQQQQTAKPPQSKQKQT